MPAPAAELGVNASILIDGNAALDAFCTGNGTDGLTPATAHVISDIVVGAGVNLHAITIANTSRFLILRNLTLVNATQSYGTGLYLKRVSHATISSCVAKDCTRGFFPYLSSCIQIVNSTLSNISTGMEVAYSNNITVINNAISAGSRGFVLRGWGDGDNLVAGNVITNTGEGIGISTGGLEGRNLIWGNYISGCSIGIEIYQSSQNGVEFLGNVVTGNGWGVKILQSSHQKVTGNSISLNTLGGIWLRDSNDINIVGNTFLGTGQCVFIEWTNLQGYYFLNGNLVWGNEGCPVVIIPGAGLWMVLTVLVTVMSFIILHKRRHKHKVVPTGSSR